MNSPSPSSEKSKRKILRGLILRLIDEEPFFGHVLACSGIEFNPEVPVAGMKMDENLTFIIGKDFFKMPEDEQLFVLEHEVMHFMFQHPARLQGKRMTKLQNIAMDLAVNSFLCRHCGKRGPANTLLPEQFSLPDNRSYEWYLSKLNSMSSPLEGVNDENHFWEMDTTEGEQSDLAARLYNSAKLIGAEPGGELREIYRVRAIIDWRVELLRCVQPLEISSDWIYSKRRLSKRYDTVPGTIHDYSKGELFVVIDVSGSIDDQELGAFVDVIKQLHLMGFRIHVFGIDVQLQYEEEFFGQTPKLKGGGGTRLGPPMRKLLEKYPRCNQFIILTDGFTSSDDLPIPGVNLVWVLTPNGKTSMPWGTCINMKIAEN